MTAYIRQRRSLPKRATSKAQVFEGRNGASKSAFRRGTVPSDVRKAALVDLAKSVAAAPMSNNDARKLARKKRVGATLSAAGGVAGVTGLGLMAAKKPKAALWASTIGGGIGGTNALLQGPIQRAEAKALDPRRYLRRSSVEKGLLDRRRERQQRRAAMREKLMNAPHSDVDDFTRKIPVGKSMPTGLSVPRGLRQRKTYTASSVRALPATGRLVRTKPGVR